MNLPRSIRYLVEPWEYDAKGRKRLGSWSQTYSGGDYWIIDPLPEEIFLVDIVVGLSNAARYRGQTKFFYPVLTHCVLVSEQVEKLAIERGWSLDASKEVAFEALLHDASEAYLGDVARPLKRLSAMKEYCRVEALWDKCIQERFGIRSTTQTHKLIKEVDVRICIDEARALMRDPEAWLRRKKKWYVGMEPLGVTIPKLTPEESIELFTERYTPLWNARRNNPPAEKLWRAA